MRVTCCRSIRHVGVTLRRSLREREEIRGRPFFSLGERGKGKASRTEGGGSPVAPQDDDSLETQLRRLAAQLGLQRVVVLRCHGASSSLCAAGFSLPPFPKREKRSAAYLFSLSQRSS